MYALIVLIIPLILAGLTQIIKKPKTIGTVNCLGYSFILAVSLKLLIDVGLHKAPISLFNFFYLDALSVFFIFTISVVDLAAALYSISYIEKDLESGNITERKARVYYLLFNLFSCSMFFVPVVNNLGMLWVAIEITTLVSTFLVGFYNTKQSVEAAWKYIIICSVGIILALFGTILFSYAFSLNGGGKSLNWTDMMMAAGTFDQNVLKIAFIFILVGYGTKAGLAPMHTWLPDAHSQAIAPVSAMLSGVLLKTALYAILRFGVIVTKALGAQYFSNLMILLGVISLLVSAVFVIVQKDIKRLLAYSSIEHLGIIAIGFGLGGTLGFFGALMHIFNHAVTKSLMFFSAGNIVETYKSHNLNKIRGVFTSMPFTGLMLLVGVFALTGFPPFSIFVSEIVIIAAAFLNHNYLVGAIMLLAIVIIFSALIYHFGKVLFGNPPKGMIVKPEPLSGKLAFIMLLVFVSTGGLLIPWLFKGVIFSVIDVLRGI